MSWRRIRTLIKNEIFHGPKDVVLVMAVAMPVLLSLFVNLAFGNLVSDRAKLGIYDEGHSQLTVVLSSAGNISLKTYDNEASLKAATENGTNDMGIVIPANFDSTLASGTIDLKAYVWGESPANSRAVIPAVLTDAVHEIKGTVSPVNIDTVALGNGPELPWKDRLLPLLVLLAIFFGGMMIPASSLINEKNRHTLEALSVSPASIGDIFTAKGVIGTVLAAFMGILTLLISGSLNSSFLLLIPVLVLGSIMAAEFGLISGAFIKDMNTLFAFWKFGGIILFGPAIVFMFPQIPQWIGYIFPTFYFVKPVFDLGVNGSGFTSITPYLAVLIAFIFIMAIAIYHITQRLSTKALRLNE